MTNKDYKKYKSSRIDKRYRGQSETEKTILTLQDKIYANELLPQLKCFQVGTIASKADLFAKITLILKPRFILTKKVLDCVQESNRYEFLRKKGLRIFAKDANLEDRINKVREENSERVERIYALTKKFLQKNAKFLKTEIFQEFTFWETVPIKDLINGKYATAFNKQIYSMDTTRLSTNFELTCLIDNGSRYIVSYICTIKPPSSNDLIRMFTSYFTPELQKRCVIIHCDRCGSNISKDFVEFVTKNIGTQLSFTNEKYSNQLIEGVNKSLKSMLKAREFLLLSSEVSFDDLAHTQKLTVINDLIKKFNTMPCRSEYSCDGSSRKLIDDSKEFFRKICTDFVDNNVFLAKSNSEEGILYILWTKVVTKSYLIYRQLSFFNLTPEDLCNIIADDIVNIKNALFTKNKEIVTVLLDMLRRKEKIIRRFVKQRPNMKAENLTDEEITNKLRNTLKEEYDMAVNEEDKRAIQTKLIGLALDEKYKKQYTKEKNEDARKELEKNIGDKENLEEQLSQKNEVIRELTKQIEEEKQKQNNIELSFEESAFKPLKLEKTKILKASKSKEEGAIMPEDFTIIIKIVSEKCIYTPSRAKYRILHVILRITGEKISCMRYFSIAQLDNFMNKKSFYLKNTQYGGKNFTLREIPYVKQFDPYIAMLKEDYKIIKNLQKENSDSLYQIDKNNTNEEIRARSEMFGGMDRSTLVRQVNSQLKEAGELMNPRKKLTSNSYRKGFISLVTKTQGADMGKTVAGYTNLSSIEPYMEDKNRADLKSALSKALSVKDSKSKVLQQKSLNNESDFGNLMDEAIKKDSTQFNSKEIKRLNKEREAGRIAREKQLKNK